MKKKPFCYAPWVSVRYRNTTDNRVSPCCQWNDEHFTGNITEYYNSKFLKNVKSNMIKHNMNEISKTCIECINAEKHNVESSREYYNNAVRMGTFVPGQLNKLDLRPDTLCNLKCIMCSPKSSSLIEEELIKHENFQPFEYSDTTDVVDLDLSNLKALKLVGGEPTISKKMFYIMDHLIEKDIAKNISIEYITNCTSVNKKWLSRVEQFKKHMVTMSVDATGKCFEYIRHGTSWELVERNILKLTEIADDYDFNIVAQATNFAVIEDWFEYFIQYDIQHIRMSHFYGDYPLGLNVIPDYLKQEKINYLEKFDHPLATQAITYLKNSKFSKKTFDLFWKNTEIRDKRRNVSIFDVSPVFEKMKNSHM
jgi:hypothetical protein